MTSCSKKSCLRGSQSKYCKVQFIDDDDEAEAKLDETSTLTPPASPTPSPSTMASSPMSFDSLMAQDQGCSTDHMLQMERKKNKLLKQQIQHLQCELSIRDAKLKKLHQDRKCKKVATLVNEIMCLLDNPSNDTQCASSIESVQEHLQTILTAMSVAPPRANDEMDSDAMICFYQ
ncbi:hypothetical protein BC940DRAFT_299590 [Gongronella butleri]|nr:hypothetical protein BC940DRAFT_299590 [Gongronella butleri]